MSPEQASGLIRVVSPLSDVYSLGAILYEMLTGRPPFVGESFVDTILRVVECEPTPPRFVRRGVDRELEEICMRCLEKRPRDRYASAAALAEDLERFLHGAPVDSCTGDLLLSVRRSLRRYPALCVRCVILLAVGLIVALRNLLVGDPNENVWAIEGLLFGWAGLSLLLQGLLAREEQRPRVLMLWTVIDPLLITALIYLSEPPRETLLAAYPVFIAASGLWIRERLVVMATCASVVAYTVLLALQPDHCFPIHHPLIFAALLVIVGFVVGFQVRRLRMLNQFL